MARTTVNLEETLLKRIRTLAAKQEQSLSEALNTIVADYFRPRHKKASFRLHWKVMAGDRPPPFDPADRDHLFDYLEDSP